MSNEEHEAHSSSPQRLSPWNPLSSLTRCWGWALPIGVLLACIATFALIQAYVPVYRASCLLVANSDYVVFPDVFPTVKDLAKAETTLLKSPVVLDPVLDEPGIRQAPSLSDPTLAEKNVRDNLTVASAGTDSSMIVSYEDRDPEAAAKVCNAIVASYLRQRNSFEIQRVEKLGQLLGPEIQRWEQEVTNQKRSIEELSKATANRESKGLVDAINGFAQLAKLRERVAEVSLEVELLNAKIEVMSDVGAVGPESDSDQTSDVSELVKQQKLLEAELNVLKRRFEDQKAVLEQRGRIAAEAQFAQDPAELQFAKDEFAVANEVLKKLRQRMAEIRTERHRGGAVRPLAPATTPRVPVNESPIGRIVSFSALAFFAPFLLGYLLGFRPRRESNVGE